MFPPVRTLIVHRSNWYSRTGTPSITIGSLFSSEFPLSNLTDGLAGPMTRFAETSVGVQVTLTGPWHTNIVGILNHNLDPDLLIQPYIDGVPLSRSFSVAYPNCWIDLRAFADDPLTATGMDVTNVELRVSGNSKPIAFGEIVVAGGYIFNGTIEAPWTHTVQASGSLRRRTVGGVLIEASAGTIVRPIRLNLQVGATEAGYLQSIWDDVGEHGEFVLVVPTTRVNDLWCVRWPKEEKRTYPHPGGLPVHVPLELLEEAAGVLV